MNNKINVTDEVRKIQGRIGDNRYGVKFTTVQKVAKQVLLNGWFTYMGRFIQPKVKHIGCGVYEVWGEQFNPQTN